MLLGRGTSTTTCLDHSDPKPQKYNKLGEWMNGRLLFELINSTKRVSKKCLPLQAVLVKAMQSIFGYIHRYA